MAKSKIIKELANNDVSLEVALRRLLVIASDIEDTTLLNWVTYELNGYKVESQFPDYRIIPSGNVRYSGVINGAAHVKNHSFPLHAVSPETLKMMMEPYEVKESVSVLEKIVADKMTDMKRDLSFFQEKVFNESKGQLQCLEIWVSMDFLVFERVLSALRTRILETLLTLDKKIGNLDELDLDISNVNLDEVKQIVLNILYQGSTLQLGANNNMTKDNSTHFSNAGSITNSNVATGKGINQSLSNNGNGDEIRKVLSEIRELWNELEDENVKGEIEDALDQIETELTKEIPSNSKFERAIERMRGTLQPIKDVTAVTTLLVHTNTLAPLLAAAFGG